TILYNQANATVEVMETTLKELEDMTPDITAIDEFVGGEKGPNGLEPGDINKIIVLFEFVDNGEDKISFKGMLYSLSGNLMLNKQKELFTMGKIMKSNN